MSHHDEINDGMTFILELRDAAGVRCHWTETLRGDVARKWYELYRTSDWAALRREGPGVFCHPITESEFAHLRKSQRRCVFIHTSSMMAEEMSGGQRELARVRSEAGPVGVA